jgi:hypothetical protein
VTSASRSECGTTAFRLVGDARARFGEPVATLRRRPVELGVDHPSSFTGPSGVGVLRVV